MYHRKEDRMSFWAKTKKSTHIIQVFLYIPSTAPPSERVWSDGGNIVTSARAPLMPTTFRKLIFLKESLCNFGRFSIRKL